MGNITLKQAAQWCGGQVEKQYETLTFLGASNDTRSIQPGQLFLALQGARDGHEFIPAAMERGAAAVLCSRKVGDYPAIVVDDPRIALGQIAREERRRLGMTVVGITGSVGKSTTKEMVAQVLGGAYRVGKTPVNHNNDIGMPMAILGMEEGTQVAVLEMGINHFGEMSYLSRIAMPDIAVILNIGMTHIEFLESVEGIRRAKLEIVEGMAPEGQLLLNADDVLLRNLDRKPVQQITYFGASKRCKFRHSRVNGVGGLKFQVDWEGGSFPVEMTVEGAHYVSDAMAAVSVGLMLGVTPECIQRQLRSFRNIEGRQQIFEQNGFTIIKDCYNAGPKSMAAALTVLGDRPGRRIAVLGDMLELGRCAPAEHYRIGRIAAEKADLVLAYGHDADRIHTGCITGGMKETNVKIFTEKEPLIQQLKRLAKPGDTILVKGSRGMHMEVILDAFLEADKKQ